jgi:hypothetical protein
MQRSRALAGAALVFVNVLLIFAVIAAFRHLRGADGGGEETYGLAGSAAQSPEKQSSPVRNTESAPVGGTEKIQERAPAGLPSLSAKPASRRRTAASGLPNAVAITFWNNDGSIFKLEASGRVRRFYFTNPGPVVAAKAGDLAFEGVREGQSFSGQVFLFNENCAPLGYTVKGSASADEATIRLHGKKPRRDAQCAVSGYGESELVFTLANSLPKQEASFQR